MKAERIPHPADDDEVIVSLTMSEREWREFIYYESAASQNRVEELLKSKGVNL